MAASSFIYIHPLPFSFKFGGWHRPSLCRPRRLGPTRITLLGRLSDETNRPDYEPSRRKLTWKNGAEAFTFSSEEADRLRGPQFDLAWADELAAWTDPQACWDMLMLGLRLGQHPRWLATTTPRPIKLLKDLLTRKDVVISRATTFDNAANLAPTFLEAVKARYEGTRLGRQELNAELLSDTPGALWQLDWLDKGRVVRAPELKRIVVAIDPAVSNNEGSDETGIVVAGIDHNDHGYEQARQRRAVEWLGPEPTEPADIALLAEIRSWVRSLPEKERAMKMLSVASSGDKMALRAVLNAPSYLTGLDAKMMERIRDEMFRRADPVQHEKDIAIVKALNVAERAVDGVLRFIDHEVGGIEEKEAA